MLTLLQTGGRTAIPFQRGNFEPLKLETLLCMTALICAAGTFTFQLSGFDPSIPQLVSQTSIRTQIVRGLGYIVVIGICFRHFGKVVSTLPAATPLIALASLAILSAIWSPDPAATLRKAAAFSLTMFSGYCLGVRYPGILGIRLVVRTFFVMLLLSVIVVFLTPRYGIHQATDAIEAIHAGEWRGIFGHRTMLGQMAALCFAMAVCFGRYMFASYVVRLCAVALSLLCLIMADSGGGFFSAAFLIASTVGVRQLIESKAGPGRALMISVLLLAATVTVLFHAEITQLILFLLGKSSTLTGRTPIWEIVYSLWLEKPILGYGFSAGFNDEILPFLTTRLQARFVADAQNGYLHALISIGVIGLACTLWFVGSAVWRALNVARVGNRSIIPLVICIYFLEVNLVESWFLEEHNFALILFSTAFGAMAASSAKRFRKATSVPPEITNV